MIKMWIDIIKEKINKPRSVVINRLLKGVGANALGKLWVAIIQFFGIYVLTSSWGVSGYGLWLMVCTVPTYIALSDFGLGAAAATRMTIAITQNEQKEALRVFQSVWVFITSVTFIFSLVIVCGTFFWLKFGKLNNTYTFSKQEIFFTILVVSLCSLLTIQMNLLKSVYQSTNKYALGTIVYDLTTLFEGIGVAAIAWLKGNILLAAIGMLIIRFALLIYYHILLSKIEIWFKFGWAYASRHVINELMAPSFAVLALTLANAIGIQGVVLTLGWVMGPVIVGFFVATRTLTRFPLQLPGLVLRASLPELTKAQIAKNDSLLKKIMKVNIVITFILVVPSSVIIYFFGSYILGLLSHGKIHVDNLSLMFLTLSSIFCAFWNTLGMELLSVNKQGRYTWHVLIFYTIFIIMPLFPNITYHEFLLSGAVLEFLILSTVIIKSQRY